MSNLYSISTNQAAIATLFRAIKIVATDKEDKEV
jgi:hypothetical protein